MSLAVATVSCTSLPRDPEQTLARIKHRHTLRVGLTESSPWVVRTVGDEPAGAEPELVRRLAAQLGATPDWHWGSENRHMNALKRFELDLVVAGLDAKTPWSKEVGVIRPYFEERLVVGVTASQPVPNKLDGLTVSVRRGDPVAAELIDRHAKPLRVPVIDRSATAVAAPDWFLEHIGYTRTNTVLETRRHVMAVPPGENGWIVHIEQFLWAQRNEIKHLLQSAAGEGLK
jgi:polar amino acid transport system substrate-binding protein